MGRSRDLQTASSAHVLQPRVSGRGDGSDIFCPTRERKGGGGEDPIVNNIDFGKNFLFFDFFCLLDSWGACGVWNI